MVLLDVFPLTLPSSLPHCPYLMVLPLLLTHPTGLLPAFAFYHPIGAPKRFQVARPPLLAQCGVHCGTCHFVPR